MKIFIRIVGLISSFLAVISIFYSPFANSTPLEAWRVVIITILSLMMLASVVFDIYDYYKAKPSCFKKEQDIKNYMYNWISTEGKVVLFSNDLSWVNSAIKELLLKKAKQHELTICLSSRIELTNELEASGASIFTYSNLNFKPNSRFTIIKENKDDRQIAISKSIKTKNINHHYIYEYQNGGPIPIVTLAYDLVNLIKLCNDRWRKNGK